MSRNLTKPCLRLYFTPLLYFLVCIAGCTAFSQHLSVSQGTAGVPCCDTNDQQHVQLRYLGAGGYLIRRGNEAILTAPFFSNPSLLRVGLWFIRSNPEAIDKFLPPLPAVQAILVGHAHYDHLMDIPYIAQRYTSTTTLIYGSITMENILWAVPCLRGRLVALDAEAAIFEKPGTWQYIAGTHIRFMAIHSEHAPHFFGLTLYTGDVFEKLETLPTRASGWKEGQTFAYLIDFLNDDGSIAFRIHYQDAASTPPLGFPPILEPKDQRRVDVAIVCVPGFDQVRDYPEGILLYTKPRFVILGHWEDFFRPWTDDPKKLKVVPLTDPYLFIARMKKVLPADSQWVRPNPGAWLRPFKLGN